MGGAKKTVVVDLAEAGVDHRILLRARHRREVSKLTLVIPEAVEPVGH